MVRVPAVYHPASNLSNNSSVIHLTDEADQHVCWSASVFLTSPDFLAYAILGITLVAEIYTLLHMCWFGRP